MMKHLWLWVILVLFFKISKAQYSGSFRIKNITLNSDSLLIDTAVIVNGSVIILNGENLLQENADYTINYYNGYLKITPELKNKPLQLSYKTPNIN